MINKSKARIELIFIMFHCQGKMKIKDDSLDRMFKDLMEFIKNTEEVTIKGYRRKG
jgi:hypothetical protein